MRGSDFDIMFLNTGVEVFEDDQHSHPNKTCLFMETDDIKPCFIQLRVERNRYQFPHKYCEKLNGKQYLSSKLLKEIGCGGKTFIINGPCLSNGYFDLADCVHCKTRISQAVPWIIRSNNKGLSYNVKQSLIEHGVLFVPVGLKESPKENLEWRLSFSVSEKLLIHTFTHSTYTLCSLKNSLKRCNSY